MVFVITTDFWRALISVYILKSLYSTHTKSVSVDLLKTGTQCPTLTVLVTVCFSFCLHDQYVCFDVHIDTSAPAKDTWDKLGTVPHGIILLFMYFFVLLFSSPVLQSALSVLSQTFSPHLLYFSFRPIFAVLLQIFLSLYIRLSSPCSYKTLWLSACHFQN